MTESMNLDSNDIVGSLSGFEGLETIEAELDILNQEESDGNIRVVHSEDMEMIPTMISKSDITEIKEEMDEEDLQDEEEDEDMTQTMNESMTAEMMEGNEIMHEMMQDDEVEMEDDEHEMDEQQEELEDEGDVREPEEHDDDQEDLNGSDDQHRLFSEGVIGDEEIIDDSQIITEDVADVHHLLSRGHIHDEQILEDSEVKYLDDIMNDDVNETIIEAAEVEDRTGDPEGGYRDEDDDGDEEEDRGMVVEQVPTLLSMDHVTDEIITADRTPLPETVPIEIVYEKKPDISTLDRSPIVISSESQPLKSPKIERSDRIVSGKLVVDPGLPPLPVVSKADAQVQEAVKSITSGVYVMNSSGTATPISQTLIQTGGTLIAPKDTKISRVMTIPNIEGAPGQTIRIVAPAGKFNSTAKAITLAQARQMGLISPSGRINNILPSTAKPITSQQLGIKQLVVPSTAKKTVTVVKSPTKILPAPPAAGHKPQKVLIRQANTLKTGTIVTSGSSGHPPGTHMIRIPANQTLQQILPGGSKQVQYVKLVSGGSKGQTLVPVSLSKTIPMITTNILNSPTTTFKVVPISTQAGSAASSGQRVFIPASAVNSTQSQGISQSQIVMLPSHLLQQVKKGDCKLVPAISSGGLPAMRTTATVNGNRKVAPAPPVPPIKIKDPVPIAASTPVRVLSTATNASVSIQATTPASLTTATSPPTPPSLLPTPAATPPTPPGLQTSSTTQGAAQSPQGVPETGTPTSGSSPTPITSSMNIGVLPQPKIEVKQEQWSGDESYFEANGIRPRKPCNCTKSMCLKLYCDCFANGEFCFQCNCTCCYNNLEHEEERQRAIKSCLERNPTAFRPKIGKTLAGSEERRHNRGCNCKRSGCLKNYCECFEAKIPCSKNCKCVGCRNTEMYPHGKRDDERIRYRMDSKSYDPHPGHMYTSACRQAFSMMSPDLIQATCQCLIAQAEKWDSSPEETEKESEQAQKLIIEEFGHCLVQIIDCVTKSIPHQAPVSSS